MTDVLDPRRARLRVGVGAAIVLVLVALGAAVLVSAVQGGSSDTVTRPTPTVAVDAPVAGVVLVHVLGAVERAGLFELSEGDRVVDAIAAAGGFTAEADQAQLNLARPVSDGEQIMVPRAGETVAPAPGVIGEGLINLNTADAALLETLPRVGPTLAARIIAWRDENGRFASVEDLLAITGIGAKTFDELAPLVTV